MPIADSTRILKVISAYNPWWKTGGVNEAFAFLYLLGHAEKCGYKGEG